MNFPFHLPAIFVSASLTAFAAAPEVDYVITPEDWELPAEYIEDNGFRGETILNGFWRGTDPESGKTVTVRVPDNTYSGKRENFDHTREFAIPRSWIGRRIVLEAGGMSAAGTVTVNGRQLLEIPQGFRFEQVELTSDLLKDSGNILTVRGGFIRDDIRLLSYPRSPVTVDDSYIQTSVRKNEVRIDLAGTAPAGSTVAPFVQIFADPDGREPLKTLEPSSPVVADGDGNWSVTLTAPWTDATLWSHWNPHLYSYVTEVKDAAGNVCDRQLPRPFGFREVWADGKEFYLNGKPLRFYGDTWTGSVIRNGNAYIDQTAKFMDALKTVGINAAHRIESDHGIDLANRKGFIIPYAYLFGLDIPVDAPVLEAGEAGDDGGDQDIRGTADLKLERSKERMMRLVKRWRENPSIMTWSVRGPWSRVTLDSTQQGNVENPWEFWPGNKDEEAVTKNKRRYEIARMSMEFANSLDPARRASLQNQPDSEVEWATRYVCENLDIQERAEFFKRYAQANDPRRVLWPSEYDASPFPGHAFLRKAPLQMPQGKAYPAIHVENAARYLGDSVYLVEPDDRLARWNRMMDDSHRVSPVYQALIAENFREILPGWRAAGISGMAHWVMREGYANSTEKKTIEDRLGVPRKVDPRRPGYSVSVGNPDQPSSFQIPGVDEPLEAGKAWLRGVSPLLAYIGGPDGDVWNRDHLFVSGAPVRKSVVVLNDFDTVAPITGTWQAVGADGRTVAEGKVSHEALPGARVLDAIPIEFLAPAVTDREDFTIRIKLETDRQGHLEDTFAFTVFPPFAPPNLSSKATVWLLPGEEARVIENVYQSAGRMPETLASAKPSLKPGDLVVVPRRSLDPEADGSPSEAARLLNEIRIDDWVAKGVRLLVMEQSLQNLFGMEMEDVRPRRAFVSAPGHPVFAGLEPSDFTYWNGPSDLDPDFTQNTPDQKVFPRRIWKVGNENAVATRTLVRPQVGAVRALLTSGFDLAESPLLEVAHGKGRMIFCQMDVSNRLPDDPVASRLLTNIVDYLLNAPSGDEQKGRVVSVASDAPGVEVRKKVYRAAKPEGSDGWGITNAELFFRESIYKDDWITPKAPDGEVRVFGMAGDAPLPSVVRKTPNGFEISLDESHFTTSWAKKKVAYLRSALAVNQGGSRVDGPSWSLHGNNQVLYPHQWIEGFINPYTAACW